MPNLIHKHEDSTDNANRLRAREGKSRGGSGLPSPSGAVYLVSFSRPAELTTLTQGNMGTTSISIWLS